MEGYSIYCEFDPKKHKEKFVHYLEVIIEEDGHVLYAVPSHQEKMIELACKKYGITRDELNDRCPKEYYFDFLTWLSMLTGAIAVWEHQYIGASASKKQRSRLRQLKLYGLYNGPLPQSCDNISKNVLNFGDFVT